MKSGRSGSDLGRGLLLAAALSAAGWAEAGGEPAWTRDFNAIQTDDPFLDDQITLQIRHRRERGDTHRRGPSVTRIQSEFSKSLGGGCSVLIAGNYQHIDVAGAGTRSGTDDVEVGAHYQFLDQPATESAAAVNLRYAVGGSGDERAGAENHSRIAPELVFAHGLDRVPQSLRYLRPLGVTAKLGAEIPVAGRGSEPAEIVTGLSAEYDLKRWQRLAGVHLPAPLPDMAATVEFEFETCVERGCTGHTAMSAFPGLLWYGRVMQFGVEAELPLDRDSGGGAGLLSELTVSLEPLYRHGLVDGTP